jgi:Ca2+-binding RTX toxin-like protein
MWHTTTIPAALALTDNGNSACYGRTPTIVGTPGSDDIVGTPSQDVIVGLGGDDTLRGQGGEDFICGGFGNDRLFGEDGNDHLAGGNSDDYLRGGDGNDQLYGYDGDDNIWGAMITTTFLVMAFTTMVKTRFGAAMGMTTSMVVQTPTMVMEDQAPIYAIRPSRPTGTVPKVEIKRRGC